MLRTTLGSIAQFSDLTSLKATKSQSQIPQQGHPDTRKSFIWKVGSSPSTGVPPQTPTSRTSYTAPLGKTMLDPHARAPKHPTHRAALPRSTSVNCASVPNFPETETQSCLRAEDVVPNPHPNLNLSASLSPI